MDKDNKVSIAQEAHLQVQLFNQINTFFEGRYENFARVLSCFPDQAESFLAGQKEAREKDVSVKHSIVDRYGLRGGGTVELTTHGYFTCSGLATFVDMLEQVKGIKDRNDLLFNPKEAWRLGNIITAFEESDLRNTYRLMHKKALEILGINAEDIANIRSYLSKIDEINNEKDIRQKVINDMRKTADKLEEELKASGAGSKEELDELAKNLFH